MTRSPPFRRPSTPRFRRAMPMRPARKPSMATFRRACVGPPRSGRTKGKLVKVDIALDIRAEVGEGAIWDDRRGWLWWVDIRGKSVNAFDPAGSGNLVWSTDGLPGCLALAEDGTLRVAIEHSLWHFDPDSGFARMAIDWDGDRPDNRAN